MLTGSNKNKLIKGDVVIMKFFNRVSALFLAIVITVSSLSQVTLYASSFNNDNGHVLPMSQIEFLLSSMALESEITGIDSNGVIELGSQLYAYRREYRLENIDDISWYPVLVNDAVVAIITLHGDPQEPIVSLKSDFAPQLNAFVHSNNAPFALLFEGENLYAVTYHAQEILQTYHGVHAVNEFPFSRTVVEMQFSNIEAVYEITLPEYHFDAYFVTPFFDEPMARNGVFLNVPIVLQGSAGLCWAASVSSKGRFLTGQSATLANSPSMIAINAGIGFNDGATIFQTRDALDRTFRIRTSVIGSSPSNMDVVNITQSGRPIITGFWGGGDGHMVVIRGFSSSSQGFAVSYMDPNFGFASIVNPADRNLTIAVGSRIMTAVEHLR